jgi:hypothetical protein
MRTGLEVDVTAAREAGAELAASGVASLRILADTIDSLDHQLAGRSKPYDRVPMATLLAQWGETYDRVFASVVHDHDPLTLALERFAASENGDPSRVGPH